MQKRLRFPLRFKILIAQLFLVTVALGLITFTMARLFRSDKTAYIHDLTSTVCLHTAEEANTLLSGYQERLRVFARVMGEPGSAGKGQAVQGLFEEFGDFVLVTWNAPGRREIAYDEEGLSQAKLTKEELIRFRTLHPLPKDLKPGELYVENSTVSRRFPTLTLSVCEGGESGWTASGFVRMDRLLRLAQRSRVFETFLLDPRGVYLAHTERWRVSGAGEKRWWERVRNLPVAGSTMEYVTEGRGMVGGFARLAVGGLTAGVQLPKSAAYLTSRELLSNLLLISLALLGGAALLSLFWSHRLTRPIEELSQATRMVGQGRFEIQVKVESADEIGVLAHSFNVMGGELQNRENALKELYGQLVQSEKMAAFGALGAGIAHEVKNPLAGILGIAQLSLRGVEKGHPLEKNLLIIEKETKRCRTIIENLLRFARQEKMAFHQVDVGQVVVDALAIVDHQLGINQVKVEKELEEGLPLLTGNANQLQQVLMNLLLNAQQAMGGRPGRVKVSARASEGQVELKVTDDGPGIAPEIQSRVFDPFFTTKTAGEGTGLGLSVSYGIVKDHGGDIRLESREGEGCTFIITLPPAQEEAKAV